MRHFTIRRIFFVLFAVVLVISSSTLHAQKYTVHEWGTFTTVHGSNGTQLNGIYLEEEHLPSFVYHHSGFSPDLNVTQKGIYQPVENVNVKMETPVLYFYSDMKTDVNVKVNFPNGAISQWYPQRSGGEAGGNGYDTLDFKKQYNGWISWDATILPPLATNPYSAPEKQVTPTWSAPRNTDANLVQCQKEVEKYLFYRGVGRFSLPLISAFSPDGSSLFLANYGKDLIPYVFVYEKKEGMPTNVWWTGKLEAGLTFKVSEPTSQMPAEAIAAKFIEFQKGLVSAGLYPKEAAAMLETWHTSYFEHNGLRVFWVVPRNYTDELLPLTLSPKPEAVERVLVGRSEVMTPDFEKMVAADFESGNEAKWKDDRYYLAYKERFQQLQQTLGISDGSNLSQGLTLYPNPASQNLTVSARTLGDGVENVRLTLVNAMGMEIVSKYDKTAGNGFTTTLDLKNIPTGLYFVKLQIGGWFMAQKFVKE